MIGYYPHLEDELGPVLHRWVDDFRGDDFARAISTEKMPGWEIDYEDAARHIDLLAERLANVIGELKAL